MLDPPARTPTGEKVAPVRGRVGPSGSELAGTFAFVAALVRQTPAAMAVLDHELRYVQVSDRFAQLTRAPVDAHPGQTVEDVPVSGLPGLEALVRRVTVSGIPLINAEVDADSPTAPGSRDGWRVTAYPLAGPVGQRAGVGVILSDPDAPLSVPAARAPAALATQAAAAQELQRSLMPRLPELPDVEMGARYLPATLGARVGGDWYDVITLPRGALGLVVGDVAGHNMTAAATMAQMRAALRSYAFEGYGPAAVLARLDRFALGLGFEEFATVFFARLRLPGSSDPSTVPLPTLPTALVRYANAGHPPPLVLDGQGGVDYLDKAVSLPAGVGIGARRSEAEARFGPGSTLVLYSDGLIERRDIDLADRQEALRRAARDGAGLAPDQLCDHLVHRLLNDRPRDDDVVLLVVRLRDR